MVILVVAMATTGFAHRFASPAEQQAQLYAATFALDGSDICGGGADGSAGGGCDVCRLHAAMAAPTPALSTATVILSFSPVDWAAARPCHAAASRDTLPPGRGPPHA